MSLSLGTCRWWVSSEPPYWECVALARWCVSTPFWAASVGQADVAELKRGVDVPGRGALSIETGCFTAFGLGGADASEGYDIGELEKRASREWET